MTASVSIYPRFPQPLKDGSIPLYILVTINNKPKKYGLKLSIPLNGWDKKNRKVKTHVKNSAQTNQVLNHYKEKGEKIIYKYLLNGLELTHEIFEKLFFSSSDLDSFYGFIENKIKELSVNLSTFTISQYHVELKKLKDFKAELSFSDITTSFLSSYEHYLKTTLKNHPNTIHKALKFIRTFINHARAAGVINDYVFTHYKLHQRDTFKSYLSINELNQLENLQAIMMPDYLENALSIFLFSCYTGLRYQDLKKLRFSDMVNGSIIIKQEKTKQLVSIPLSKKALFIFENVSFKAGDRKEVFHVPTNQKLNLFVKEVSKRAGIVKNVTMHTARHTFATIGLTIGIPVEVVSKLMGHRNLSTTMVYAKIIDQVKIDNIQKWDSI